MKRLRDIVAPVRPVDRDSWWRRLLRWAALPVTNRRWAAPLCALALGFGLFVGVAIGPGTSGSFATPAQMIEIPAPAGGGEEEAETAAPEESTAEGFAEAGGGEEEELFPESSPSFLPEFTESEETTEPSGEAEEEHSQPSEEEKPAKAPAEEAETVSGVVLHANPAAGSYTLVEAGGVMSAIHASSLPAPGSEVEVPTRTLANGTFAEAGKRKQTGKPASASTSTVDPVSFAGTVTFVKADPAAPAYTVSKRGVSVLVRVHPDPGGALPPLPELGAYATVEAEIAAPLEPAPAAPATETPPPAGSCAPDPAAAPTAVPPSAGVLWQTKLEASGAPFASSDFAGIVMAVCPGQLLLSGDDMREAERDIVFSVPAAIKTDGLEVGDSVAATAKIEASGALELTGLASDERGKGADDRAATQGDLVPQRPE